ncbi:MAG TPA: hypothetical protein VJH06_00975, partial [Candidatus Paceibacterota bacterium]
LSLQAKSSSARAERKNWVEPLRRWILDSKHAGFLASRENFHEMKDFLRSFGTNPALNNKTISISFCPPSIFARTRKADLISSPHSAPSARPHFSLSDHEVSLGEPKGWLSELLKEAPLVKLSITEMQNLGLSFKQNIAN